MKLNLQSGLVLAAALAAGLAPAMARASDEEIQVYMDELDAVGRFGLDVHMNYAPKGRGADVDYPGQQGSQGRLRITPEFSYGLTRNLELGLYLPLATVDAHGRADAGGVKGLIAGRFAPISDAWRDRAFSGIGQSSLDKPILWP